MEVHSRRLVDKYIARLGNQSITGKFVVCEQAFARMTGSVTGDMRPLDAKSFQRNFLEGFPTMVRRAKLSTTNIHCVVVCVAQTDRFSLPECVGLLGGIIHDST